MKTDLNESLHSLGIRVRETLTTPTKPGKSPRPVWIVEGITSGFEALFRHLGGRNFRGAWSFWEDPSAEILDQADEKMSPGEARDYKASRKLEKAERFRGYADNATARADQAYSRVKAIADNIPLGQPILVGHHSERHARADQKRIHQGMTKATTESRKADYFSDKASSLERDGTRPVSLAYIGNRIREITAEAAKIKRYLNGQYYVHSAPGTMPISAEYREQLELRLKHAEERLAYWEAEKEAWAKALGLALPSRESLKVGMWVSSWAGWYEVVRVNKKSVTIRDKWPSGREFTRTIAFTKIREVRGSEGGAK